MNIERRLAEEEGLGINHPTDQSDLPDPSEQKILP